MNAQPAPSQTQTPVSRFIHRLLFTCIISGVSANPLEESVLAPPDDAPPAACGFIFAQGDHDLMAITLVESGTHRIAAGP